MLRRLSLFKRIFLTYLVISVLLVGSLAIAISLLSKDFIYQGRRRVMLEAAQMVAKLAQERDAEVITPLEMERRLEDIASLAVSSVYVLPKEVAKPADGNAASELAAVLPAIERMVAGETVVIPSVRLTGAPADVMLAGVPYYHRRQVNGVVLVFTPVAGLKERSRELYLIIWGTAAGAMIVATFVTYLLSHRITRPLTQVTNDAVRVASGDFSYQLPQLNLQDEVGDLHNAFQKMKKELSKTEELRQALIAGVAHDLRSPLTSIRGFINAVLDGTVDKAQREKYLRIAADEAQRLVVMSEKTLQAAQLQAGVLQPQIIRFSVGDLLQELQSAFDFNLSKVGQRLAVVGGGVKVAADPDHVRQILQNLVENAIKYAGQGATITIEVASDEKQVQLIVKDDGPGISEDFRPYLFDKYSQADDARSPGRPGIGLGLSIARDLACLNGGGLVFLGEGSAFVLSLPLASE